MPVSFPPFPFQPSQTERFPQATNRVTHPAQFAQSQSQTGRLFQPEKRDEVTFSGTKRKQDESFSEDEGSSPKAGRSQSQPSTPVEGEQGLTALMEAARNGHMATLNSQLLLARHAINPAQYLDIRDNAGKTALHHAVENSQLAAIKALLASKASKRVQDNDFHTPITKAAQLGNVEALKLLCQNPDDLNPPQSIGTGMVRYPLHTAIQNNQFEVAAYLLHQGALPNTLNAQPDDLHTPPVTPLMIAASRGNVKMQELLLANGADIHFNDANGHTALNYAVMRDQWDSIASLLRHRASPEPAKRELHNLLERVCQFNEVGPIRFLLKHGVRPDAVPERGAPAFYKALQRAAEGNDLETAQLLLEGGLDPDFSPVEDGIPVLILAANGGNIHMMKLLLAHDADIDAQVEYPGDEAGQTALHQVVKNNNEALVDYLIREGAELEIQDDLGLTALTHAIQQNHNKLAKKLGDEYGAALSWDFNELGTHMTPMLAASENGNLEMLDFMIAHGVDVNQANENGVTPLMWAQNRDVARLLFQAGADIEARDRTGETALIHQSMANNVGVMRFLLHYGARTERTNEDLDTALTKAAEMCQLNALRLLIGYGANVNHVNLGGKTALIHTMEYAGQFRDSVDESVIVEMINALLDAGANVNHMDSHHHSALSLAVSHLLPKSVETLLKRDAHSGEIMVDNAMLEPLLSVAVRQIREGGGLTDEGRQVLAHLIGDAPEVEVWNNPALAGLAQAIALKTLWDEGGQPMASAQWEENFSELKRLLEAGVPIQLTQPLSFGILCQAARLNQEDKLDFLLTHGLPPDGRYVFGETALMTAARYGNTRATDVLLAHRANPNIRNMQGETPFSLAIMEGCMSTALRLLQSGADPAPHIQMENDTLSGGRPAVSQLALQFPFTPFLTEDRRKEMAVSWPLKAADPRVKAYVASILGTNYGNEPGSRRVTWNLQLQNRSSPP